MNPTVSVFVPCYNYGRYLPECVASVLTQEGVDVSVLVIDDASTDDSLETASRLAAADPRVSVLHHEANKGHIASYNEGLAWATGTYTVLLSADDLLAPGALRRATTLMEAHPDVGFVYGGTVRFRSGDQLPDPETFPRAPSSEVLGGQEWLTALCQAGRNCISSPEVVVRTEVQQRIGGYREELPHAGDLEMWMRFAANGDVGIFRDVLHAYVRDHDSNMQRTRFNSQLSRLTQRKAAFDYAFRHYGDRIDPTGRLRRAADRSLRSDALWWVLHGVVLRDLGRRQLAGLLRLGAGLDDDAVRAEGSRIRRAWRVATRSAEVLPLLVRGAWRARQDRVERGQPARFVQSIAVRRPVRT